MTRRLGASAFPGPDVDILASSNLRIGRYQAVTNLALVDEPKRRHKRAPKRPGGKLRVTEIGPFNLVLTTERRVIGIGRGYHQGVIVRKRAQENA